MATINPYLGYNGKCEEAFNFYKSVFGGEFVTVMRFKDVPSELNMPPDKAEKIMHIGLPIGNGNVLMGSDAVMDRMIAGNNYSVSVSLDSEQEALSTFNKLSSGGKVLMPIEKSFWGALFGMLTDEYGINWMVSYDYNQQNQKKEELNAIGVTKG